MRYVRRTAWSLVAIVALGLIVWPGLAYFGFCYSKGRFLSDREKIDAAIRATLYAYPPPLVSQRGPPKDPIPYASVEEFRRINPDCCRFSNSARGAPDVSFLSRVQGTIATYVLVDYLVRYRDEYGNVVSERSSTFSAITNCGDAWSGY